MRAHGPVGTVRYVTVSRPESADGTTRDSVSDADETAVTEQLQRLLSSDSFRRAPRSRALLAYTVTETLAGRGARLSERTVGRYALQQGERFMGGQDASVRVQATRLRKALVAYYDGEGAEDPLRIDLPPGSYVPTFTVDPTRRPAQPRLEPALAVAEFDAIGEGADAIARTISEALVGQLAQFPGLDVIGPSAPQPGGAVEMGRQLGARFVMQGSVIRRGEEVALNARLTDAGDAGVIWAVNDVLAQGPSHVLRLASDWVGTVAGELGDYAGVILAQIAAPPEVAAPEALARQAFYTYIVESSYASLREARRLAKEALDSGARSATLLSMYGSTLAVSAAYGQSDDPEADLLLAEQVAREALDKDPRNAHAITVMGTVAMVRGQWDVTIQWAREGVREAAGHPTLLVSAATQLAVAGEWSEGVEIVRSALRLNPSNPGHMHSLLAVDCVLSGDDASALAEAGLIHSPDAHWGPCYRALALAGLGYLEQAQQEFARAVQIEPSLADDPLSVVGSYVNFSDEQKRILSDRFDLIMSADALDPVE